MPWGQGGNASLLFQRDPKCALVKCFLLAPLFNKFLLFLEDSIISFFPCLKKFHFVRVSVIVEELHRPFTTSLKCLIVCKMVLILPI